MSDANDEVQTRPESKPEPLRIEDVDHDYIEKDASSKDDETREAGRSSRSRVPAGAQNQEGGEMSDSGDAKDKPSKPDKPKPLQMVAVDHDYIKHGQTGGTTMANKPKER